MERSPKRQKRPHHNIDGLSSQDEEAPLQLASHQETNSLHGTGIQSTGDFHVGGSVHINVTDARKRKEDLEIKQQERKIRKQERLMRSLEFAQMNAREFAIQKAHKSTCRWILTNHQYALWAQRRHDTSTNRFVWLKGKPGTGKSTIMKFLLEHTKRELGFPNCNTVLISFYFNARGTDLEKSTVGMYRSLLLQILKQRSEVREVLDKVLPSHKWTIESLESILELAVLQLKGDPVICLIDALDECGISQARAMVKFFDKLTELYDHLQVCFASRHYPNISIVARLEVTLEHQPEHQNDIRRYLSDRLQIGHDQLANQICSDILAKASGVFMWVVLVVEILNREFDAGRKHTLQKRLEQLPEDLHQLFRDILTRDTENVEGLLLCIQWILFARRPLSPRELYFAIISGLEPEYLRDCHLTSISEDDIHKYVLDNSKGLAEPTGSRDATVQFIHESVVDFLIKDNGLAAISTDLGDEIRGKSHNSLKSCCLQYIEFIEFSKWAAATPIFPFREYAQEEFVFHADQAESSGINQKDFVRDLGLGRWTRDRQNPHPPSSLYILAQKNAACLIRAHPTNQSCFAMEHTDYAMPIMAAAAGGMHEAALALLEMEVIGFPALSSTDLRSQFSQLGDRDIHRAQKYSQWDKKDVDIFVQLSEFAPEWATIVFLRAFEPNVHVTNHNVQTPLFHAISRHQYILLEHLIDVGADLSYCDPEGRAPTHWAAQYGNFKALDILHSHRCNINARDKAGQTPLHYAVLLGADVAGHLLRHGASVDAKDKQGRTPMHVAAGLGIFNDAIIVLIRNGAYIDAPDQEGRTALHDAIWAGDYRAAFILLSNRANASATDYKDQTPLKYALRSHCNRPEKLESMIDLLRSHGADISAVDRRGETLLHWCLGLGLHDSAIQLMRRGAAVSKPDRHGYTPIWWAVYANPPVQNMVRMLINHGAKIHDPDQDGYTLLHRAVEQGKLDVVKILVEKGASATTVNKHGQSPLDLALNLGFDEIGQVLCQARIAIGS